MARPRPAQPVKLFAGLLGSDPDILRRARQLLSRRYGAVDSESALWPFDQTSYYELEMGPDLKRWFLGFERLVPPGQLADIKLETNVLEQRISEDCLRPDISRPVNIDPGYVDLRKLVLATTKDAGHRVYLGRGIYAEVTLQYQHGAWQTRPWTYPDYTMVEYHEFFTRVRDRYRQQHRERADQGGDDPLAGSATGP